MADLRFTTLTDDTAEILAQRLILRCLLYDVARGLGRDPAEYRASVRRIAADQIEEAPMCVTGDTDLQTEDVRTNLIEVLASILE